jgi:hypothetical protein
MTDPYWQGSRLPALLIALFLLVMFLVAFGFGQGIIDSLYDWASGLQVWKSSIGRKWKVLVIVLVVVASLGALFAYLRYDGRKEQQAARSYAESQGWSYSPWNDTYGIKSAVEKIFRDFKFDDPHSIMIVETGQTSVFLCDCSYVYRESASRRNSNKIACLVRSERFRPSAVPLTILIQEWRNIGFSLMRWDEVAMENPAFAEKFLVLSKDPVLAREIVNESMQSMLIEYVGRNDYTPVSITIGPGGAVVMTEQNLKRERLADLVDLARRIERNVKE